MLTALDFAKIAQASNAKRPPVRDYQQELKEKLENGKNNFLKKIQAKVLELAEDKHAYGSCNIYINGQYDNYGSIGTVYQYSGDDVFASLVALGFSLEVTDDCGDGKEYILTWDETLEQSCVMIS